ncbi:caspase family protein [Leptolyngbya cf. ectocarpi LEGE 11479]|uniref:Caspase family protein n=1 Tax=Leptolyngbya cf. ectocarpi LEGE 11479 TaxID=1828722 RepID=A0A928ZXI3_LEPEC|nr:effector-associated domain EAD1-containing protein [Leptolyngbya ectocarpi]MBE9069269.1 caspase family protein [Leptolyngbya cf. ectocarpi LEGE 11479]
MTDPIKNRWAFLVGINEYDDPGYGELEFCVDDVKTLGQLLSTDLGFEKVVSIYDNPPVPRYKPTRSAVKTELQLICDLVGPDDLLLVHFACHGIQVDNQPCLVTSEVRSYNPKDDVLPVAEVETLMRGSGARCKVLLLDACHTGVDMGRDLADPEFIRHVYEQAEGFALIAASTAQQKAYEIAGHGVFTHYLLNALSGKADGYPEQIYRKGFVSVQDVQAYVLNNIKRWNQGTGQVQTPTARTEGFGDIVLAYYPEQIQTPLAEMSSVDKTVGTLTARERVQPQLSLSSTPGGRKQQSKLVVPAELSVEEWGALVKALQSAFLDKESLGSMVRRALKIRLEEISQSASTYPKTVESVVDWAQAYGKLQELIEGALKRNPSNPRLKTLAKSWGLP